MLETDGQFPLLLAPETLHQLISETGQDKGHYVILDLCQAQMYSTAHIPTAIHVPINRLNQGTRPAPGLLPSPKEVTELINELGITQETHVICYDDEGGGWAGRFIWMLDVIGHAHKSYLNGGIRSWLAEGFTTEQKLNTGKLCNRTLEINESKLIDKEYIIEHLADPNLVIWDARSPEEFRGERVFAQKGGHIPGAINYEWTRAMDLNNHLKLRPLTQIKEELKALGITEDKHIITHCQTHHRSGFTYLVGKILGFNFINAYPGSWSEWGNSPDTPVETA